MVRKKTDALVVGAGPVGLATALALAHHGIDLEVIDQEWRKAGRSYALALHPSSLETLSEYGLAKDLVERGYRIDRVRFSEGDREIGVVDYGALGGRWPFLTILPQNVLEGVLEEALAARGVSVQWNHSLASLMSDGDRDRATVERREKSSSGYAAASTDWVVDRIFSVSARFVIGADGNRSRVRRELSIPFEDAGEADRYAVFEFDTGFDAKGEARVFFGPDGSTNVYWPLPGGRGRFGFSLPEAAGAAAERSKSRLTVQVAGQGYPHVPPAELSRLVSERAPWFDGSIGEVHWSLVVRFERRLARRFGTGRAWLVGDSAHLAGPIAVASMNAGVAEGTALAAEIRDVLRNGVPAARIGEGAEARRRAFDRLLSPGAGFEAGPGAEAGVKAHEAAIGSLIPASGPNLATLAAGLGLVPRKE